MIHSSAIIGSSAELAPDVEVGPYSIIGDDVKIGAGSVIGPHVVIKGPTTIGQRCRIYQFASIGEDPQDLKYHGERTLLTIGDSNTIREYVTINRGTEGGGGVTSIGSHNLIMAYCHIAHDCHLASHIIMSNCATLAGHITIENYAIISGLVGVHQYVRIGAYAMVGGVSGVPQDVPPYVIAAGERTRLSGLNIVGLKRHGFSAAVISELKSAYRIFFRSGLTVKRAVQTIEEEGLQSAEVQYLSTFIQNSERGVMRK